MGTRCGFPAAALAALVLGVSAAAAPSPPLRSMLNKAAPSVVRVEGRTCREGTGQVDRTGTGFVWRDRGTVVTALHLVAACQTLNVIYELPEDKELTRTAAVGKVLRSADLVLLSVTEPMTVDPLAIETTEPPMEAKLEALGFPLQIPQMNNTTLSLRFGGTKLKNIVPPTVMERLNQTRSPDPELDITNIEGHLLPGLSGAPILNPAGSVVAVGDGGLDNGTVGISWGIPVGMLSRLAASAESTAIRAAAHNGELFAAETDANGTQSDDAAGNGASGGANNGANYRPNNGGQNYVSTGLFAAETEARVMGEVSCSGYTLTKVRTVPYAQIAATSDDPSGLQYLVNYFGANPAGFAFDIYQHLPSGATVALPAGVTLTPGADACTASAYGGDFTMRIALTEVNGLPDIQAKSLMLEQLAAGNPQGWVADSSFTYAQPETRFDGLLVRRRGWVHLNPAMYVPGGVPRDRYLFETFAARRGIMIHTAILNNISTSQNNQMAQTCRRMPMMGNCPTVNAMVNAFMQGVLAVHLTTFPVG